MWGMLILLNAVGTVSPVKPHAFNLLNGNNFKLLNAGHFLLLG